MDMTSLKVVVLGHSQVGKSAVTVRFLTKRFIGEYNSDKDLLYRSCLKQEDYFTDIELLDTCSRKRTYPTETHVQWADGFVVVYDMCRRDTFDVAAKSELESLHRMKSPFLAPTLLLANKRDLEHRREVGVDEGHSLALEYNCMFYEVSAAESFTPISIAFQALLRDVKITQQQRSNILRRRRSSLMTMSKKLGSIFGKKEPESPSDRKRPSYGEADFALSI